MSRTDWDEELFRNNVDELVDLCPAFKSVLGENGVTTGIRRPYALCQGEPDQIYPLPFPHYYANNLCYISLLRYAHLAHAVMV